MTDVNPNSEIMYEDTIGGGSHWSFIMHRGTSLKLVDLEGGVNVGMLLYNPHEKLERYNAPDTLKCQHTFKLARGHCLYSDMGRIFCSITEDTVGWHDTVGGNLDDMAMQGRWGEKSYQDYRNDWMISGLHSFLVELAKYGLTIRDITANINWFSRVYVDGEGNMFFDNENSQPGDSVTLRFEMDTLVIMHTCPHPMNTAENYPKLPVQMEIHKSGPPAGDDLCLNACGENQRGFKNNAIYHLGRTC
ncbi:MAG: urea carboxylase-associated family protein [Gammaproteobacteria bacterium]|nr:urea carboxylase-associated family protein [Gammaproteobacteria bacterium]